MVPPPIQPSACLAACTTTPDGVMGPWGLLHNLSRPTTHEIWDIEDKCDIMTIFSGKFCECELL